MTTINDEEDFLYSPYMAALLDKSEEDQRAFFERFAGQSPEAKELIASPDTALAIKAMVEDGTLPEEYAVAVAKIVAYVGIDEVQIAQLEPLLGKIGMGVGQADRVAARIRTLAEGLIAARGKAVVGQGMRQMPPMSRPTAPGGNTPARNIIDLRKQP